MTLGSWGTTQVAGMARKLLIAEHFVPALLTIVSNKLASSASVVYRRVFRYINATECRVILTLAVEPGISGQRISQVIGFDKGLVSRTVRSLEKLKYITVGQDEGGGRRARSALTRAGHELNDRIVEIALGREKLLLTGFSKKEADLITSPLKRMLKNAERLSACKPKVRKMRSWNA